MLFRVGVPPLRVTPNKKPTSGSACDGAFGHAGPDAGGLDHHGGAADADHQHAAVLAHHLVVDVDAHHGVGPQRLGTLLELLEGDLPGPGQLFFVGAGATADDVADAGEQILEDVGAEDGFAHDDATVLANGLAFQGGGG